VIHYTCLVEIFLSKNSDSFCHFGDDTLDTVHPGTFSCTGTQTAKRRVGVRTEIVVVVKLYLITGVIANVHEKSCVIVVLGWLLL
jgi:hypothetical protein